MPGKLRERDIQEACCDLLALDGWRRLRCETVSRREWGKGFGERGMADDLFIRYADQSEVTNHSGRADIMWCEWKSATGKAAAHQKAWHQAERMRGACTYIAGEDFPRSVDGFLEFYRKSGWMRRPI